MFTQLRDPEFAVSILWFDMCTFLLYNFFPNTFIFTSNLFQFRITYTRYRYGLRVSRYAVEMKVWVYPFGRLFIYPVRQFAYNSVKFIREYHRLTSCIWLLHLPYIILASRPGFARVFNNFKKNIIKKKYIDIIYYYK